MRRRRAIAGLAALLAAATAAGCGEDEKSYPATEEGALEISRDAYDAAIERDIPRLCELISQGTKDAIAEETGEESCEAGYERLYATPFVRKFFEALEGSKFGTVEITEVGASVNVVDGSGVEGTVDLFREDDEFRVDALFIEGAGSDASPGEAPALPGE